MWSGDSSVPYIYFSEDSNVTSTNNSRALSVTEQIRPSFTGLKENVFNLEGFTFSKCTQDKIKFSFKPSSVVRHVVDTVVFYCTLCYNGRFWRITRETFPHNYKSSIFNLFWNKTSFIITDKHLNHVIKQIHSKLMDWAKTENEKRQEKFQKFLLNNSDVDLDSDDEILFLTEEERIQRHLKRNEILQRMIPPERYTRRYLRIRH